MNISSDRVLDIKSGNSTFLQLDIESISVTGSGLTLTDDTLSLHSNALPSTISIEDNHIAISSSDYNLSLTPPSDTIAVYTPSDQMLNISGGGDGVTLSISDVHERININDELVEYVAMNMSISLKAGSKYAARFLHHILCTRVDVKNPCDDPELPPWGDNSL